MKFNLIVDKSAEPSVTVVCSKVDDTVCQIERLCNDAKQDSLWVYIKKYTDNPIANNPTTKSRSNTSKGKLFFIFIF